jgi:hypothetical protein
MKEEEIKVEINNNGMKDKEKGRTKQNLKNGTKN